MLAAVAAQPAQHFTRNLPVQTNGKLAAKADPFAKVIAETDLSRAKLLAAFAGAGMQISADKEVPVVLASLSMPSTERFYRVDGETPSDEPTRTAADQLPLFGQTALGLELAYASVEPSPDDQVQLALASVDLDLFGIDAGDVVADVQLPENMDAPELKPAAKSARDKNKPRTQTPAGIEDRATPARKPRNSDRGDSQQALAYARPNKPADGVFKNLFNTPKAGKGVAIYDISAAVVHMPDGTKLEAHSGIGKMADNPKFVHVKMNGPTPPNTYKLSMREKRFHGVEAVRMTPIGNQTMHGRDGILAHSYLLRGGRPESHGCVAFKDYNRFLKAFKQGKVTHIVVVPSMSKASKVQLASIGRDS
ncbi:MAG: DUF2778 domain-containing protein [Rhizobiaceae bacterium]|nr:DUF2778 domain-containing protein [Rhizobiaceae bacterium]